jgi:hypothetical protein
MNNRNRILNSIWAPIFMIMVIDLVILPFVPWWGLIFPTFAFGRMYTSGARSFLQAGVGSTLAWAIMVFFQYQAGGEIIVRRVSEMMGVSSPWILILITLLIPMIIGGLAGVSGFMILGRKARNHAGQ